MILRESPFFQEPASSYAQLKNAVSSSPNPKAVSLVMLSKEYQVEDSVGILNVESQASAPRAFIAELTSPFSANSFRNSLYSL